MPSTAISISSLTKSFPAPHGGASPPTTIAVDHVSLAIPPGELFFLLGPSGCGKTTLLRMIAGFIDPTAGSIAFIENGQARDVTRLAPNQRNAGMVFQSYALWPHMTIADNVAFGLDVRKVKGEERTRRVFEALAAVRMQEYAQRKPNQLSGGQQQRVALARALVIRPSVLLLDEPLSNLDARLRLELRAEIRRVCKESGITTVYVTHDQKEALSMADRVAIMRSGLVEQLGTPHDLYRAPNSRFVAEFLGETNLIEATILSLTPTTARVQTAAGVIEAKLPLPEGGGRGVGLSVPLPAAGRAGEGFANSPEAPEKKAIAATTLPKEASGNSQSRFLSTLAPNTAVLLSIRPEALRPAPPTAANTLSAISTATTYLGDLTQHDILLGGNVTAKLSLLNPSQAPTPIQAVQVDPADVVILRP